MLVMLSVLDYHLHHSRYIFGQQKVYHYHHKGESSPYWPYLALLPTQKDQEIVPIAWPKEVVGRRLAPSEVVGDIWAYQLNRNNRWQIYRLSNHEW